MKHQKCKTTPVCFFHTNREKQSNLGRVKERREKKIKITKRKPQITAANSWNRAHKQNEGKHERSFWALSEKKEKHWLVGDAEETAQGHYCISVPGITAVEESHFLSNTNSRLREPAENGKKKRNQRSWKACREKNGREECFQSACDDWCAVIAVINIQRKLISETIRWGI